jgi:ATP-dependent Clp protease ATP-binding subunit ClpA
MSHLGVYKDRFADGGLRVFERAIKESQVRQQNYVTVGHILKALGAEDAISFVQLMRDLGGHTLISEELIESVVESGPAWTSGGVRLATEVIRLLKRAMMLARAAGREKIESGVLLGFRPQQQVMGNLSSDQPYSSPCRAGVTSPSHGAVERIKN